MYLNQFQKAAIYKKEACQMLKEQNETEEVKDLVTSLNYNPVQTYQERYNCIKKAKECKCFSYFRTIAYMIKEGYKYSVDDSDDMEFACVYYGSEIYDFEFILLLSKYYQHNPTLFAGHIDVIRKMFDAYHRQEVKAFWLKIAK